MSEKMGGYTCAAEGHALLSTPPQGVFGTLPKNDNIDQTHIIAAIGNAHILIAYTWVINFWSKGSKIQKYYLFIDLKFITIKNTLKLSERFITKL